MDLVPFFFRSSVFRSVMVLHMIVAAGLLFTYQTVMALQLTGEQQAQRSVGSADYLLEVGFTPATVNELRNFESSLETAVQVAGGSVEGIMQTASFLDLDGVNAGEATLVEGAWDTDPFPERFMLTSGRWPSASDEVVIQQELDKQYSIGDRLSLFSGAVEFTVVGVAQDAYQRSSSLLLAAPGAWERVISRPENSGSRFSKDSATTVLRWNGGDPDDVVSGLTGPVSNGLGIPQDTAEEQLSQSLLDRRVLVNRDQGGLDSATPLIGVIPLTLLPALTALVGTVLVSRFANRARTTMWRVGLSWHMTAGACLLALIAAVLVGSLAGCVLGLSSAALIRPIVDNLSSQTLSPFANPTAPAALLIVFAILGAVTGSLLTGAVVRPRRSASERSHTQASSLRRRITDVTTIIVIALTCIALSAWVYTTMRDIASMNAMSTAVIMLAVVCAGVLALLVRTILSLPQRTVTASLAIRRFAKTPILMVLVSGGLALALSIPVAIAVTAATQTTFSNQTIVAPVPEGQVDLGYAVSSGSGLPPEVRTEFEATTGLKDPIVLRTALASSPSLNGLLTVVPTQEQLGYLLKRPLTNSEKAAWENGAILSTATDTGSSVQIESFSKPGILEEYAVQPLLSVPEEYRYNSAGFISGSTAQDHQLSMEAGYFVYTNASEDQVTSARQAPENNGFDSSWVRAHVEPEKFTVPVNWLIASSILGLVVSLISVVIARSQAKSLRPYMSGLDAVGIPPRILRRTVTLQMFIIVGLPCLGGVVAGWAAAAGVWAIAPEPTVVTMPWSFLLVMLSGGVVALILGVASGLVRLQARERFTS